ncbi:MAG: hypothetical protein WD029_07805 [Microthrixaceae bacterium]
MLTLFVGILIVVLSALGFGYALFGRRPLPQPAMGSTLGALPADLAEAIPSSTVSSEDHGDPMPNEEDIPLNGRRARDVTITAAVRARAVLLLFLSVVGIAAIIGVVLSVVVVGVVFVVT